jgi:hypothetical protein
MMLKAGCATLTRPTCWIASQARRIVDTRNAFKGIDAKQIDPA